MESLNSVLPVLLYICGIILLIVLIILGIRLIATLAKVDRILDNVEDKVNALNSIFAIIDKIGTGLLSFSGSITRDAMGLVNKIFRKRKRKEEDEEDE